MPSDQSSQRTAQWVQAQGQVYQYSRPRSKTSVNAQMAATPPSPQSLRRETLLRTPVSSQTSKSHRERSSSVIATAAGTSTQMGLPSSSSIVHSSNLPPTPIQARLNGSNRPFIPTAVYHHPNLPAFVQGPPGSGYPMSMTPVQTPQPPPKGRMSLSRAPSPPTHITTPLNPNKSRPFVHKRRPSLSGAVFEPPRPDSHSRSYKDMDMPIPERRLRRRATSESRQR